jgi:Spy/CpxP family protein refolding chaperone
MRNPIAFLLPLILTAAWAQPPQGPPPAQGPPVQTPPPGQPAGALQPPRRLGNGDLAIRLRPGLGPLEPGPRGRWWTNPQTAKEIGLSTEQQKKMDDIFQQNRLALIDLNAAVEKQEVTLEPLVSADQPDEARILAQIDHVAQARADLEKANARMLLGIRRVLTADQWQKLKAIAPPPGGGPQPGRMPGPPR